MKVLSCLLVVLFAVGALAAPPQDSRIVGGSVAQAGVHRWLVSLRVNNAWGAHNHFCGGSIVHNAWVVTAAHCLPAMTNAGGAVLASFRAWSGTNLLSSGGNQHAGVRAIPHPQYTGTATLKNDIALIQVQNIGFNNLVQLIRMNFAQFIGGGVTTTVGGWGAAFNGGPAQNQLRQHTSNTLTTQQCINQRNSAIQQHPQWSHAPFIDGNIELCTFHSVGQGTCQGDSGSPLVQNSNTQQVGVVSWGFPCAIGGPDVYVRTSAFAAWIRSFVPNA